MTSLNRDSVLSQSSKSSTVCDDTQHFSVKGGSLSGINFPSAKEGSLSGINFPSAKEGSLSGINFLFAFLVLCDK